MAENNSLENNDTITLEKEKGTENTYNGKILTSLNLLKIIAIFFVLFYHIGVKLFTKNITIGNITLKTSDLNSWMNTLIATCVPLFFLVSGALLLNKPYDHKKHIKRCLKLLLLTYVFSIVVLLIEYPMYKFEFKTFLHMIINLKTPYNNHLWFLQQLLIIYMLFPFLKLMIEKHLKYYTFIVCFSILLLALIKTEYFISEYNILLSRYAYSIVYFALGGILEKFIREKFKPSTRFRIIITIVLILTIPALMYLAFMYKRHFGINFFNSYQTVGVLSIALCIYLIFRINDNLKYNKFLFYVSSQTLFVYVFHYPILNYLQSYLVPAIPLSSVCTKLIVIIALYALLTAVGYFLCKIKFFKSIFKL